MESIQRSLEIESHQIDDVVDQDLRELEEARSNSDGSGISSSEADESLKDNSSDDSIEEEYKWDPKDKFFFGIWPGPWLKNFTEECGPKNLPVDEELTPLIVFSLLFYEDLMSLPVQNTNGYARIYIDGYANQDLMSQYLKEWRDKLHKEHIVYRNKN